MKRGIWLATVAGCAVTSLAHAEEVGTVFSLGEVSVSTSPSTEPSMGNSTVTQDDIRLFDRNTLDTALKLAPGVSTSETGGRNESLVWIRGYGGPNRAQIPVYWDGIPIYLPYDDRIDFARFTTSDIGEIQVTKSYTSVIDGPGAIGGSINLVSRQVTKPFEGDARLTTSFDQNGAFNGIISDVFAGSRQDNWYVQGSGTENYQNHFRLSDDFQPGTLENGGNRDHSWHEDHKLNFKLGYTPAAGDEYSLNFIDQQGDKGQPLPDTTGAFTCGTRGNNNNSNMASAHCWTWPDWDKQSVYWLSKTELDNRGSYMKTRLYYDRFYDKVDIWDNTLLNSMNNSIAAYGSQASQIDVTDDRAAGSSIEMGTTFLDGQDSLRGAMHFRWDQHNGQVSADINPGRWFGQPWITDEENTYSAAIENTYHPVRPMDVTVGLSYDYRQMLQAQDFYTFQPNAKTGLIAAPYGAFINYPLSNDHALNPQMAVAYHYDATGTVHSSLSDRTRFPTLFEMFSNHFGSFTGNAALQPERALTWEGGVADTIERVRLGGNVFYSHLIDAIERVNLPGNIQQNQNVGGETHQGFELEVSAPILPTLEAGTNYSFLVKKIDTPVAYTVATDTPRHDIFAYLNWKPLDRLSVVPSIEFGGKRWLQSAANQNYYYRGGDYALANLKISYQVLPNFQIEAGVKNLFDQNYAVEDGYNGEGRNIFTTVRVSF